MDEILFTRQINERQTDAFCRLFKDFFDSLLYFATGYVECKEVAEDVVQEVFVDIWEGKMKFRSYNSLKTFLYTSVRNACVDWLRHQRVEKKYADVMRRETSDDEEDFAYKVMREEIYRELFAVIEELPDRRREIFRYHMQGKSNAEIAEIMDLSVLTVKTQKVKAVQYIKERMGHLFFLLTVFKLI